MRFAIELNHLNGWNQVVLKDKETGARAAHHPFRRSHPKPFQY